MATYLPLYHRLTQQSPGWPGNPTLQLEPIVVEKRGYTIQHYRISVFNHFGTHLDGPRHFNPSGAAISDFPFEFFIFRSPVVVDIVKGDGELITLADLERWQEHLANADLILFRTGFGKYRALDPDRYANQFPALSVEVGHYVVERLPTVRGIGIDTISIGSYVHIDEAFAVHQILAQAADHGHYIVNLEDLNLDYDLRNLKTVLAIPLPIEGVDSAPAIVLGVLDS